MAHEATERRWSGFNHQELWLIEMGLATVELQCALRGRNENEFRRIITGLIEEITAHCADLRQAAGHK